MDIYNTINIVGYDYKIKFIIIYKDIMKLIFVDENGNQIRIPKNIKVYSNIKEKQTNNCFYMHKNKKYKVYICDVLFLQIDNFIII